MKSNSMNTKQNSFQDRLVTSVLKVYKNSNKNQPSICVANLQIDFDFDCFCLLPVFISNNFTMSSHKDVSGRKNNIAKLNDVFRIVGMWGINLFTLGVIEFSEKSHCGLEKIMDKIRNFSDFTEENDPYGEHDFWSVDVDWVKVLWKIDYYDKELKCYSEDPSNPVKTIRVMTVMLADEY